MIPRQSFAAHAEFDLDVRLPPIQVDGFPLPLTWHARQNRDVAVQHVAGGSPELPGGEPLKPEAIVRLRLRGEIADASC
ncbi:hypothetical protein SAMN04488020_11731 [Palleronia marisminoris]|uniref:Uncharacterized protein n=2 Tax=Palleronia marisminoris TaxID=315423 RepID=A0A1Y5TQP8_9RHOB|nr:hypothetical protein SAMN04488020_11731 [Palleronia marisminoris]SLN69823.1 hypothetical protein PAM7066_03533 [Palleronia marisminoris]